MKILIVPSWYTSHDNIMGSGGIFHYEQASELAREHTVAIYYPFDRTLPEDFLIEEERGILTFRSFFSDKQRLRNRIRIYRAFRYIFKEFNPDIVHTHVATEAGRYTAFWCAIFHIPFVVTEHSTVEVSGVDKGLAHIYAKYVYGRSRANCCVSEDLQCKLSAIFPHETFFVMYNGIQQPKVIDNSHNCRKENCCNIVLVAALYDQEIKGLQFLLPVLQKLIQESYRIVLHIIGSGEYEGYFHKLVDELGISEHVIFYGNCEKHKVYDIVSQMDFLVSASLVESFGCSMAEALMLGKPVLATRCGGPEGFVKEEVGILVEKGSADALYEGMRQMLCRKNEFVKEEIQEYARGLFDNSIICNRYVKMYQDAIDMNKVGEKDGKC